MANTTIDLVGLDFSTIKNNLTTFLKNNTQFKDIDYEGSNINVLLDLLSYNTYLNAFYTNMVASEMFLDTAQLRDSVVSHAKELNYVPRSFQSAKATITVDISPATAVTSVVVPEYTSFTSRVGSNTYTFSTAETQVLLDYTNGTYSTTIDVYEGIITSETFVVNPSNTAQRYVLSNPTIDTSSLSLTVYEDNGQTIIPYLPTGQLFNINDASRIYFIQAAENQQYEIVFGDGVYGKKPKDGAVVVAKYRACSGELPNGASLFVADGPIDGHTNISVTTVENAAAGTVSETVSSIKFNAPRFFQAQNRAVTAYDYEVLLKSQFADIRDISAYGGEDAIPPQFGKVFIAVDINNTTNVPGVRKSTFLQYIKDKTPLTITAEFINPSYLYAKINTSVLYNVNSTNKSTADINTLVQSAISNYNTDHLDGFKKTLYYSPLTKYIDNADQSIIGNDTSILLVSRLVPQLDSDYQFTITTYNALETEIGPKINVGEVHYGHTFKSTSFTYKNSQCILVDDTLGNVFVAAQRGDYIEVISKVGTIDYVTGSITVSNFNISSYDGNYIECIFRTLSRNIEGVKNLVLRIDPNDVSVTVTGVKQ